VPSLGLTYPGSDLPALIEEGRRLQPDETFVDDSNCLEHSHDFTLASSSLQYFEDWRDCLRKLAGATSGLMLVAQLPAMERQPSCVLLQRAYCYNYSTEYLGWCFNRDEFLSASSAAGLTLVREFLSGEHFRPYGAAEDCRYRACLFQSRSQ
jgi:putative methyltransferase (TIGR04325 family)